MPATCTPNLHVGEPELAQGVAERLVVGGEAVAQAVDDGAERVDREPGLVEAGLRGRPEPDPPGPDRA